MYYLGTLTQCLNYDKKVRQGEAERGAAFYNGDNWANPIKHPDKDLYAILKNESYKHSTMTLVDVLPDDWIKDII